MSVKSSSVALKSYKPLEGACTRTVESGQIGWRPLRTYILLYKAAPDSDIISFWYCREINRGIPNDMQKYIYI